ncbi:MAG: peptidylprolyl isomerase [Bryobacteraceae bacterium]|jgi:peptidyl-prolyl cis-trans isomerase SurA
MPKLIYALPALLVLTGCHKSPPANVAATVNNRPITYGDIDRIYLAQFTTTGERAGDDLMAIQKMEVLRTLIENEIMLQRAEKLGLLATESEVDAKFNELKAPYTQEEFQRQLEARKITANDLKTQMRRELSIQKLLNREIISKIAITDKEISDFFNANKASFNRAEPTIHLAQILVTAAPDPNARNLKNDKAVNEDQARKKIQMIEARLHQGDEFSMLAENYSEDPESTPSGGDLGFLPMSAFDKSSPEVRKLILSMQPGQVSPIIPSPGAYRILKVISKEPAGQRDLNDPRVQQIIRDGLRGRKEQLLRNAYYEVARDEAKIVNYFSESILESKGKTK